MTIYRLKYPRSIFFPPIYTYSVRLLLQGESLTAEEVINLFTPAKKIVTNLKPAGKRRASKFGGESNSNYPLYCKDS